MLWNELTQDEQEAVRRIETAIEAEQQHLGPDSPFSRRCAEQGDEDLDTLPQAGVVLSEWVLVCAWTERDTGLVWTDITSSPMLPSHHKDGLLRKFL